MRSRWSVWLERTGVYRWLFCITVILFVFIEQFIDERDIIFLFYLGILVISALSFRKVWLQAISSGIVTFIMDHNFPVFDPKMILFHWFWSFGMASFIMTLIEKYISEKRNSFDLILSLAKTLDSRDNYTAFHSQNVAMYSKGIAEEMNLDQNGCKNIFIGGLLHDIGKIGVPENILNKAAKLTQDEYEKIKEHPVTGYNLVKHIKSFEGSGILSMILYHHERYDGKGYPKGLKGTEIPLEARILAVADTFDAMTSRRVYREALELPFVLKELQQNKGTQFDPSVVDAFLRFIEKNRNSTICHNQQKATQGLLEHHKTVLS